MANIVQQRFYVNVAPGGVETVVHLAQHENGRVLSFYLGGEASLAWPAGSTATLTGRKPDGTAYSSAITVDSNKAAVHVQESTTLTAVAGEWYARINVTNGDNMVATALIKFVIHADPAGARS